ncbi:progestin and adipoQ receptor family member 3-like isoform X2 [Daktulosphaira vitifoliae]|uniref:progestin and adipoQ receptor family member 3-like isoform X2 n=2 Tax=Daktulosphaira vitifoliae TaxID=58002 RepID=UPI0021AA2614|nr:progestin and adipoQ receptor family member 3-like isoform X2 [Daktulosphaira vitifoliae]
MENATTDYCTMFAKEGLVVDGYIVSPNEVHKRASISQERELSKKTQDSQSNCIKTYSLLEYHEVEPYLQSNPYITSGYRNKLSTKKCIESIFWLTNETINIWSHLFGWMLFFGLTIYDLMIVDIRASQFDRLVVVLLLGCFQICMIMSSIYHTFGCKSEKHFHCFLSFDLFGIAMSLLAIYLSGIYYAFWCHSTIQTFYLATVFFIFVACMIMQIPKLEVSDTMKMVSFVAWAAYGVIPSFHWFLIMGGWENPLVSKLLPRIFYIYFFSALAFFIYATKVPERFFKGKVNYFGSSHQWWHFLVVYILYYWHNTGILYIEYRMNHSCAVNL